jgi:hypothetical protein
MPPKGVQAFRQSFASTLQVPPAVEMQTGAEFPLHFMLLSQVGLNP